MRRILIVDDDDLVLKHLSFMLERAGYRSLQADDGDSALALARSARPHLVLLDAVMPRLDGFATMGAFGADPLLRSTPVIMMTSLRQRSDVLRAQSLGVCGYVVKPIDLDDLLSRIQRTVFQAPQNTDVTWFD